MMRDELVRRLSERIAQEEGVRLAILFGSRARDEARDDSDVDLAVDAPGVDLVALSVSLEGVVERPVDVVSLDDPKLALLASILHDGVLVRERTPGAWGLFRSHSLMVLETDLPMLRRVQDAFVRRVAREGLRIGSPPPGNAER